MARATSVVIWRKLSFCLWSYRRETNLTFSFEIQKVVEAAKKLKIPIVIDAVSSTSFWRKSLHKLLPLWFQRKREQQPGTVCQANCKKQRDTVWLPLWKKTKSNQFEIELRVTVDLVGDCWIDKTNAQFLLTGWLVLHQHISRRYSGLQQNHTDAECYRIRKTVSGRGGWQSIVQFVHLPSPSDPEINSRVLIDALSHISERSHIYRSSREIWEKSDIPSEGHQEPEEKKGVLSLKSLKKNTEITQKQVLQFGSGNHKLTSL